MKSLRFTPYAWAKLRYIQFLGKTEVSFMAITTPSDPTLVVDVRMPKQVNGWATTEFVETGLADFFELMVDEGRHPANFGRIWCHTHPGESADPSTTDCDTFAREFSTPNWAMMFIVGTTGKTTCRLKYRMRDDLESALGSHHEVDLASQVDWSESGAWNDAERAVWKAEYDAMHSEKSYIRNQTSGYNGYGGVSSYTTPTYEDKNPIITVGDASLKKGRYGGLWVMTKDDKDMKTSRWFKDYKDYTAYFPNLDPDLLTEDQWNAVFNLPDAKEATTDVKKTPLSQYKSGGTNSTTSTTHSINGVRRLTKREKKYFKKHGTLVGFFPPGNSGFKKKDPPANVEVKKPLTTNRGIIFDEDDDDTYELNGGIWQPRKKEETKADPNDDYEYIKSLYEEEEGFEVIDRIDVDKISGEEEVLIYRRVDDIVNRMEELDAKVESEVTDEEIREWVALEDELEKIQEAYADLFDLDGKDDDLTDVELAPDAVTEKPATIMFPGNSHNDGMKAGDETPFSVLH